MQQKHRHLAIVQPGVDPKLTLLSQTESEKVSKGDPGRTFKVGELAKRSQKTVRALHLYEDLGLLSPVSRSKGGYRLYNAESVDRVTWIVKLQSIGFSLPELQNIMQEQSRASNAKLAARQLENLFVEKLQEVQVKLAELHRLENELLSSLTYLGACQSACEEKVDVNSCPACGRHLDQPEAPSLVAGLHTNSIALGTRATAGGES